MPNPLVKAVFDDWQWSGVATFAKGLPTGINLGTSDGADIAGGGDGVRPNLVADATTGGGQLLPLVQHGGLRPAGARHFRQRAGVSDLLPRVRTTGT